MIKYAYFLRYQSICEYGTFESNKNAENAKRELCKELGVPDIFINWQIVGELADGQVFDIESVGDLSNDSDSYDMYYRVQSSDELSVPVVLWALAEKYTNEDDTILNPFGHSINSPYDCTGLSFWGQPDVALLGQYEAIVRYHVNIDC